MKRVENHWILYSWSNNFFFFIYDDIQTKSYVSSEWDDNQWHSFLSFLNNDKYLMITFCMSHTVKMGSCGFRRLSKHTQYRFTIIVWDISKCEFSWIFSCEILLVEDIAEMLRFLACHLFRQFFHFYLHLHLKYQPIFVYQVCRRI